MLYSQFYEYAPTRMALSERSECQLWRNCGIIQMAFAGRYEHVTFRFGRPIKMTWEIRGNSFDSQNSCAPRVNYHFCNSFHSANPGRRMVRCAGRSRARSGPILNFCPPFLLSCRNMLTFIISMALYFRRVSCVQLKQRRIAAGVLQSRRGNIVQSFT